MPPGSCAPSPARAWGCARCRRSASSTTSRSTAGPASRSCSSASRTASRWRTRSSNEREWAAPARPRRHGGGLGRAAAGRQAGRRELVLPRLSVLDALAELLHAGPAGQRLAVDEADLRHLAQPQARSELVAHEPGGMRERLERRRDLVGLAHDAHVDLRERQVLRHFDVGDAHHGRRARVAELLLQDPRDLATHEVRDLLGADPHWSVSCQSSTCACRYPSTMWRALFSSSCTCAPSAATTANPIAARCQRSWYSTSATEARTRSRIRSLIDRTTCRLSFNDCAPGKCNSNRTIPTTILILPLAEKWERPPRRSRRAATLRKPSSKVNHGSLPEPRMKMCGPRGVRVWACWRREACGSNGWRSKPNAERGGRRKGPTSDQLDETPTPLGRRPLSSKGCYSVLANSSILNDSSRSPCCNSLKPSRVIPHSKPFSTSRTSSLNRLSASTRPVHTVWSPRTSRIFSERVILPVDTMQPATTTPFDSLNDSSRSPCCNSLKPSRVIPHSK